MLRIVVVGYIAMFSAACTGGAYQTGMLVSGASFGDVREVVRNAAPEMHLQEDPATNGFFRTDLEGVACGGVVVVISVTGMDVAIEVEQSCSPRWTSPKEYTALAKQLRQVVEARFGKERVRGLPSGFQSRS